jgi:hypothetical protein
MAELTARQIDLLNRSNRVSHDVKLGTLLNGLLMQVPKEKHFCQHCWTISENTNSRGNCIACGAPFGENK